MKNKIKWYYLNIIEFIKKYKLILGVILCVYTYLIYNSLIIMFIVMLLYMLIDALLFNESHW